MKVCTLASGSSGNSVFIKGKDASVIVDAGMSGKSVEKRMQGIGQTCAELSAILVTHEHIDHVRGVGVLSRRYNLPVYTAERTWAALDIGNISEKNVKYFAAGSGFEIGSLKIESFSVSHDANDPVGFTFYQDDVKVGLVTDTGCLKADMIKKVQGADCLIMEANHDVEMLQKGTYPWSLKKRILSNRGHLSNVVAGHSLASLVTGQTKHVALAHLSEENNSPELAYATVSKILADNGLRDGKDVDLQVAPRSCSGCLWQV